MSSKRTKKPRFKQPKQVVLPQVVAQTWVDVQDAETLIEDLHTQGATQQNLEKAAADIDRKEIVLDECLEKILSKNLFTFEYLSAAMAFLDPVDRNAFYNDVEEKATLRIDTVRMPNGAHSLVQTQLFCIPITGDLDAMEGVFDGPNLQEFMVALREKGVFRSASSTSILGTVLSPWSLMCMNPSLLYAVTRIGALVGTSLNPIHRESLQRMSDDLSDLDAEAMEMYKAESQDRKTFPVMGTRFLMGIHSYVHNETQQPAGMLDPDFGFLEDGSPDPWAMHAMDTYAALCEQVTEGAKVEMGIPVPWTQIRYNIAAYAVALAVEAARGPNAGPWRDPKNDITLHVCAAPEELLCVAVDARGAYLSGFTIPAYLMTGDNVDFLDVLSIEYNVVEVDTPEKLPKVTLAS